MPTEITQQLGFDASQAITALEALQRELRGFQTSLQAVSADLDAFNTKAAPAVSTMAALRGAVGPAKAAMTGLGAAPLALANNLNVARDSIGSFQTSSTQTLGTTQHLAGAFGDVSTAAETTSKKVKNTGEVFTKTKEKAKNAASGITLSWKTVARIVAAQVVVRSLGAVTQAFRESQMAAKEFSLATSEAFTISTGALGSMDRMSASVLELANNIGLTADEVAEGVYQTLSNQVVEAADSLRFAESASKLSIATNTDLKTAVNALSSVMNSYGLEVAETDAVANTLFKTIEFGRLRLDEFGDVLGRVSPLTAELGISYQELAGAIAALTQKGVPAHTAITQLTQVSQKLLKPTAGLQALYEEWMGPGGTGPEAIRRFGGMTGVLLKMKDATAGNDAEFAKLLGRVRSIVGALNLTSDSASAVTEIMGNMEEDVGALARAFEAMERSIGRRTVAAWAELGNLMVSLGTQILQVTTPLVEWGVKFAKVINPIPFLLAAMAGGAYSFAVAAATATGTTLTWATAVAALNTAMAFSIPILLAMGAAAAGMAIGKFIGSQINKAITELERFEAKEAKRNAELEKLQQERIANRKKEFAELNKAAGEYFSELTQQYQKDFQQAASASKSIENVLKESLQNIASQREKSFKKIRDAILDTDDEIKKSAEVAKKTQQSIIDANIKASERGLSERSKIIRELSRLEKEAAIASKGYVDAGVDAEALASTRKKSYIVEEKLLRALSSAENLKQIGLASKVEKSLAKVRADRIRGETTFGLKRKDLQDVAHRAALRNLEQQEVKLQELLKSQVKTLNTVKDTEAKSSAEREKDAANLLEIEKQIAEVRTSIEDSRLVKELGLVDEFQAAGDRLEEVIAGAKVDWTRVINDFQAQLEERQLTVKVKIDLAGSLIAEQIEATFGPINELGGQGMLQSRLVEQAQENIEVWDAANTEIVTSTNTAMRNVERSLASLDPSKFHTRLNEITTKASTAWSKFLTIFKPGDVQANLAAIEDQAPAIEKWRKSLRAAAIEIRKSIRGQKPLDDSIKKTIASLEQEAEQWYENGDISVSQRNRMWRAFKPMITLVSELNDVLLATSELDAMGLTAETVAESVKLLEQTEELAAQRSKNLEAQKAELKKAGEITNELGEGVAAEKGMPEAVGAGTTALGVQLGVAKELNLVLKDNAMVTARQEAGAAPGAGVAPAGGAVPSVAPAVDRSQEAAQATEELKTQVDQVNISAGQTGMIINGIKVPMKAVAEPAMIINESFKGAEAAVKGTGEALPTVIEGTGEAARVMIELKDNVKATDSAMIDTGNSVVVVNEMLGTGVVVAGQMATAMDGAAQSARAAASACAAASRSCAGGSINAHTGGRFFAAGGRGTDTVPAMLTPGEFIVNKRSAGKFFPQLQAMNAGMTPNFRGDGGEITNVGDINVTVTDGGESHAQTARQIAVGLRRELRRKTIRLR